MAHPEEHPDLANVIVKSEVTARCHSPVDTQTIMEELAALSLRMERLEMLLHEVYKHKFARLEMQVNVLALVVEKLLTRPPQETPRKTRKQGDWSDKIYVRL
jgi:hypothetical protein